MKVSVLTTAYNGERFIEETIDSILDQSFEDFEYIIIDDGSTDRTKEIIKKYKDKRIKYYYTGKNKGHLNLNNIINFGLSKCKGKYIARTDADDISLPHRLEKQVDYLNKHKDIFMIGASAIVIDEFGNEIKRIIKRNYPSWLYKYSIGTSNSFVHSSIMFRNEGEIYPSYIEHLFYVLLIFSKRKIKNIPNVLVKYRINPNGLFRKCLQEQMEVYRGDFCGEEDE